MTFGSGKSGGLAVWAAGDSASGACFIEVGDIDLDGRLDLVFPNVFSSTVAYLLNDGNLLDPRIIGKASTFIQRLQTNQ